MAEVIGALRVAIEQGYQPLETWGPCPLCGATRVDPGREDQTHD